MSRDALIVGINNYQYLPSLQAPANDAESIARCFESFGECRVTRLPEAITANKACISLQSGVTAKMLEEALIKLFKPAGKNIPQQAVFYYSGHGLQRDVGIQEGYLATSDVNPAAGIYGVSLYWLRRLLQESPVRQRVILLDCCHSGEFFNILEADPGSRAGTDRLFMAASREYEAAYESLEGSHSVFTQALLSGLNPYKVKGGIVNGHHLIDIVNNDLKGELQQPLFESSGSEIILTRAAGQPAGIQVSRVSTIDRLKRFRFSFCPFIGPQPFETAHAEFFFGRETITQQLFQLTASTRLCAVIGASGIGKTSLLKAGLIPYLQGQGPDPATHSPDIRYMVPGIHPLKHLAEAFVSPRSTGLKRAEEIRRAESFLHQGTQGFTQLIQAITGTSSPHTDQVRPLVLIVDQFEQLFPAEVSQEFESERRLVIDCLLSVARHASLPIKLVLGIRSDCLERLQRFTDLYTLVCQHQLVVPHMTYDQVKATITGPLEKIGLHYDANLIYTLLLDAGGTPVDLSSLQRALKELWLQREHDTHGHEAPRLTLDAYTSTGGIRGLLSRHASAVLEALPEAEKPIAQRLFTSLCTLGDGNVDSRRQAQLCELVTPAFSKAQVLKTLETLVAARLIVAHGLPDFPVCRGHEPAEPAALAVPAWSTTPQLVRDNTCCSMSELLQSTGSDDHRAELCPCPPYYEIAHDALIRHWPLLREWLSHNRLVLKAQQALEASALEWHSQNQPNHPDYFLSQSRLNEAKAFHAEHPNQLSLIATDYLQACGRHIHRHRRKQYLMSLLIPLSMALGMAAAYGHSLLTASRHPAAQPQTTSANAGPAASFQLTAAAEGQTPAPQIVLSHPHQSDASVPWTGAIQNGITSIPIPWSYQRAIDPVGAAQPEQPEEFLPLQAFLDTVDQTVEALAHTDRAISVAQLPQLSAPLAAAVPVESLAAQISPTTSPTETSTPASRISPDQAAQPLTRKTPAAPAAPAPAAIPLPQQPFAAAPLPAGLSEYLPVTKVSEWPSATDPQIQLELWCVPTEGEPLCFIAQTSRTVAADK